MNNLKTKLSSRKLWLSVAGFLAAFGTAITGVVVGEYSLAGVGAICAAVSAGIYAASEAYVDAAREASNTTAVTATSSSQKVVEGAFKTE